MNNHDYTLAALPHYIECALWASTEDDCSQLDGMDHADLELSDEMRTTMLTDLEDFVTAARALLDAADVTPEMCGHDFWLTRNGHGTGFWDRDLDEELGERLTALCKRYPERDLYIGDDGLLYCA